jgi:EAL domain-containing protein (putative c-di-GMP-specific phosphodiesterase class I)
VAVAAMVDRLVHHAEVIVNANMGRQAMVVGMRHFTCSAGSRLVAEGVETDEEANTLGGLGVESSSATSSDALSRVS